MKLQIAALVLLPNLASGQGLGATPLTTEWRFTGATGDFIDSVGGPGQLEYADGAAGQTAQVSVLTTTGTAGIPDIGGVDTPVLYFDYHTPNTLGFKLRPLTGAANDDLLVFTLVFDLYLDPGNTDIYGGLLNGSANNLNDAELFLQPSQQSFWYPGLNGGLAQGSYQLGEWFRIVYAVDYPNGIMETFVDGAFAFSGSPADWIYDGQVEASWILADQNGEVTQGYLANFAVTDALLGQTEATALGTVSSGGIFGFGVGANYCTAVTNSTGAASIITALGSGSIADNSLILSADNLPAQPGIFIAGPDPAQIPFFNGFLCVSPNGLQRFLAVNVPSGGVITEAVDLSTSVAGGLNAVAGLPYHFQRWNRDPAAGGASANFSDGVAVPFTP